MSKVWFITGSSRGLGRSFTEAVLASGDKVAATARNPEDLNDLLEKYPEQVYPLQLDVTSKDQIVAAVERTIEKFGRIDVLVNNAGFGIIGATEAYTDEQVRSQLETNLYAPIAITRAVLPYMRKQRSGRILQISSIGGKHLTQLTPEDGNHVVTLSPSEDYFIDSYSKPDVPAITVFRNMDGKLITNVDKTDVSRLAATGWKPLTTFSVKAHDGVTDIYGLMYTPTNLDPNKKYPIIDYIYPGPQGGSVGGNWSFAASRGDNQALAELGFIVVQIEGTSNPWRQKSYHDMNYGNMGDNTLPDQVSGIRQLAQRFAYIDTTRVGIWGHSGGGFATACAMFRYPDFFKVGISESGNHDNRNYEDDWGERYDGLAANSNYEAQANETYAKNLKGKLMLAHGMMDNNVPPENTLLVVEALERANKDYDLVIFPNSQHGYGAYSPYMMRRRWDYFVKNLLGGTPPKEYVLKAKPDPRNNSGM